VLLPLKGVYATSDNMAKYERKSDDVDENVFSSPFAAMVNASCSYYLFHVQKSKV
jgi:3-hydroxy-3-methylglutaryl CoA synthase